MVFGTMVVGMLLAGIIWGFLKDNKPSTELKQQKKSNEMGMIWGDAEF